MDFARGDVLVCVVDLIECASCRRHVRSDEERCVFCRAELVAAPRQLGRCPTRWRLTAALATVGTLMGASACPAYGATGVYEPIESGSGGASQSCQNNMVLGEMVHGVPDATCRACLACTADDVCRSSWGSCNDRGVDVCDAYLDCVAACLSDADQPSHGGNGNGLLDESGDPSRPSVEEMFFESCVGSVEAATVPSCVADHVQGYLAWTHALSCSVCAHCDRACGAADSCF